MTSRKIFSGITRLQEFDREFKKLSKKYKTLKDDIKIFVKVQLQLFHKLKQDNQGVFRISNLGISYPLIYKAKKFACKSLKGTGSRSGIRVIYAYYEDLDKIEFIEIYYKGSKENEDRDRINKYYMKP